MNQNWSWLKIEMCQLGEGMVDMLSQYMDCMHRAFFFGMLAWNTLKGEAGKLKSIIEITHFRIYPSLSSNDAGGQEVPSTHSNPSNSSVWLVLIYRKLTLVLLTLWYSKIFSWVSLNIAIKLE